MKYLLDTDVVIDHIKGKRILPGKIIETGLSISIITYGELLYGAEKSKDKDKSFRVVFSFLEELAVDIVGLDKDIMALYAQLKANLEVAGQRLDNFDLLIGVTAAKNNFSLITRNIKHFERIKGLKIISG